MKKLLIALAAVLITATSYGQGQVVFANLVGSPGSPTATVDAPVTILNSNPTVGPGNTWQAQLFVQGADGSLTAVPGALSPFRSPGTGAAAIADRYWSPSPTVTVPGVDSGATGTFVVGAYPISFSSYDAAKAAGQYGQSAAFQVTVGGGLLAPANLTTLKAFTAATPEPSILALGALGASALLLRRRK